MRLTHLKLAGFKSFVDTTTIHLHGQRVGVVGPNGCGKSNVMESVRWVLGESSSKEMRADGMDAIIFNGSANRKPISRASVELIFDNSLGGANGEWSQYAEISVKRVIEREKGSTYYINNTAVRRRDVADLFSGTGLGGRAYAIIGQNTISRIVEAKPEELRVFLEEAAGISKYKDRRRETELRLRDTRDNLTRVEDICRELHKQITRLESQAVVTEQYHELQAALKVAEGQLWLLKKRDASHHWGKAKTNVEKLVNQLEAQTAELRKSESTLEASRQAFYLAGEAINTAQAAYYEANAEVANLENQVKQNEETRQRITLQLEQITQTVVRINNTQVESKNKLKGLNDALDVASTIEAEARTALETLKIALPEKEAARKVALESAQKSQQSVAEANQRIQIEKNNIQYLLKAISENEQRNQQLAANLSHVSVVDESLIKASETSLTQAQEDINKLEHSVQKRRTEEDVLQGEITTLREEQNEARRHLSQAEAEANSLQKIQQSLNAENKLSAWLSDAGFESNARLWQKIKIDDTWSVALEAVLGDKLNALISTQAALDSRPPSALVVGFGGTSTKTAASKLGLTPLTSVIKECPAELKVILEDWLAGVYLLSNDDDKAKSMDKIGLGEKLVSQQGDVISLHSIAYHGENSNLHGVIARQERLEVLQENLPSLEKILSQAAERLHQAEKQLTQLRQQQLHDSNQLKASTNTLHQQQLELAKLQQNQVASIAREKNIKIDIDAAKKRHTQLLADLVVKEVALETISAQMNALETVGANDFNGKQNAEDAYLVLRDSISESDKEHQQANFELKIINNNINELNDRVKSLHEEKEMTLLGKIDAEKTLSKTQKEVLKANLSAAVDAKQAKETVLAKARDESATKEAALQELERSRMQNEQALHPMRDNLEKSRLAEQEARLHFEQCQASLEENGLEEHQLAESLEEGVETNDLSSKTTQLQQKIERLGAVNLAAIEELTTEAERKGYLDSQVLDLTEASETLAAAISKIDRETREKLLQTFNQANTHFGELFSTLFGGGQAKLELLGNEILDTGLQVFAQPPGKKNTTIQLLSGGEKALTALALVFALFRLNPAPFCLMDEVDAPLDDSNTERFCAMVKKMSEKTQFLFVSHNKITMEIAQQLIGVTMQESGVSRIVDVDMEAALEMHA